MIVAYDGQVFPGEIRKVYNFLYNVSFFECKAPSVSSSVELCLVEFCNYLARGQVFFEFLREEDSKSEG